MKTLDIWRLCVGFLDGSNLEFKSYCTLEDVEDSVLAYLKDGALDAVEVHAEAVEEKLSSSRQIVQLSFNLVPSYGGKGFTVTSPALLSSITPVLTRLVRDAEGRAREARGERVLNVPPTMKEKGQEFIATFAEVAKNGKTAATAARAAVSLIPTATGQATAAFAGAGTMDGLGGLASMVGGFLQNEEAQEALAEIKENPELIAEALKAMGIG